MTSLPWAQAAPFDILVERQSRVVRREQLLDVGVSPATIKAELNARRWQAIGPVVIVLHNGPLTETQQQWAVVLSANGIAALASRTAAAAAGLEGWPSDCIEVVVERGDKIPRLPGVDFYVHESRRFTADDIHSTRLPPQTPIARSIIDAAAWSRPPRTAAGILCASIQQRLTTVTDLSTELDKAGKIRHGPLIRASLLDIDGGAEALSEIDFKRLCRRYRLPITCRQEVRYDRRGRKRYIDATLTGPDGRQVRVEVDGAVHLLVRRYWNDMYRGNELVIADAATLRFPSYAVRMEPEVVVDQLRRALGLPICQNLRSL
jgi:hypothetical protein